MSFSHLILTLLPSILPQNIVFNSIAIFVSFNFHQQSRCSPRLFSPSFLSPLPSRLSQALATPSHPSVPLLARSFRLLHPRLLHQSLPFLLLVPGMLLKSHNPLHPSTMHYHLFLSSWSREKNLHSQNPSLAGSTRLTVALGLLHRASAAQHQSLLHLSPVRQASQLHRWALPSRQLLAPSTATLPQAQAH